MFLIELAIGNLFDNFLRRGRSSVIVGVLLFDTCVWPVSHARSGSAGISNHKEIVGTRRSRMSSEFVFSFLRRRPENDIKKSHCF